MPSDSAIEGLVQALLLLLKSRTPSGDCSTWRCTDKRRLGMIHHGHYQEAVFKQWYTNAVSGNKKERVEHV